MSSSSGEYAYDDGRPIIGAPLWAQILISLGVAGLGAGLLALLIMTRETKERKAREAPARLVDVHLAEMATPSVHLSALGQVKASRSVELTVSVGGQIDFVHNRFNAGGRFTAGETILRLDQRDFQNDVAAREADVTLRQSDLALEHGFQQVAQREYALLGDELAPEDAELVLRKPQLQAAQAQLQQAKVALDLAQLNLERTTVQVPFDGLLLDTYVEQGASIAPNGRIAHFVATDTFWVEALWREDELSWLRRALYKMETAEGEVPDLVFTVSNPSVWGDDISRSARFVRILPLIESQGRLVPVLVAVDQPLASADGKPPLLLDSFVRVDVHAGDLEPAIVLPRGLLRQDDTVWVAEEGYLRIKPVEVVWRDREQAVISSGLSAGDQIISSYLSAPTDGLRIRIAGADDADATEDSGGGAGNSAAEKTAADDEESAQASADQ